MGIGTWGMGGKWERNPSNKEESKSALKFALELGYRLIDAAEIYGDGLCEEIVGAAVYGRKRKEIFIISKVWKTHLKHDDVLRAAEGSLKRLKTDYIDLYLVHWPNPDVPLKETMSAMESLVDKGLIKNIGVSNFDVSLIEQAQQLLRHSKIAANQIEYNIAVRSAEKDVLPFCRANDIKVIAYRPLASGALSRAQNGIMEDLSRKYNKTPAQIALNWIICQRIVAVPGAAKSEHVAENYGALGWKLEDKDIWLLDKAE